MPSSLHNSPFLHLRQDDNCGRQKTPVSSPNGTKLSPFSSLTNTPSAAVNGGSNGYINGHDSGVSHSATDEFIKLDQPQQDVLLLHGPRQRYSLEKAQEIPELREDREILVQVLAIGLNPVDWKGADYGILNFNQKKTSMYILTSFQVLASPPIRGLMDVTLLASSSELPGSNQKFTLVTLFAALPLTTGTSGKQPIKNSS